MSSFFHSIKTYFKAAYDGRYFAVLLRELAQNEPESFKKLVKMIGKGPASATGRKPQAKWWSDFAKEFGEGRLVVKSEYEFITANGRRRRADLAILQGTKPRLLFEVKEFDHLNPTNLDQIVDYLRQVKKGVGFVCVYRFLPQPDVVERIRELSDEYPATLLSYNEIHEALKPAGTEVSPLARLINAYLEDIGVGVYEEISLRGEHKLAVTFLLNQMLGVPHFTGGGKIQSDARVRQGPELLGTFLSNIEFISEWCRTPNLEHIPRAFSRRFWIAPYFDQTKLERAINKHKQNDDYEDVDELPDGIWKYVKGGVVNFEAIGGLKTGKTERMTKGRPRLEIMIGIALQLGDASNRRPPTASVYASFASFDTGTKLTHKKTYSESNSLSSLSENVVLRETRKVIAKAKEKAAKQIIKTPLGRDLENFVVPPAPNN